METSKLVEFESVDFSVGNVALLNDLSFSIKDAEILTIIGPNGAGKSTAVKLLLGLLQPSKGKIFRRAKLKVSYVPQKFPIDPALPITVQRLIELNSKMADKKLLQYVNELGISNLLHKKLDSLSGGELQRVLLARAIAQQPELLVLDEPLQGIDYKSEKILYSLMRQIRENLDCSILMISHDLKLLKDVTDMVLCLDKHVCCYGKLEEVAQTRHYADLYGCTEHHYYKHEIDCDRDNV